MRALVPLAAGSLGGALVGWRSFLASQAQHQVWRLVGIFGLYVADLELRFDLLVLALVLVELLVALVAWVNIAIEWINRLITKFGGPSEHSALAVANPTPEERGVHLTSMAVVAAAARVPFPPGTFILVTSRSRSRSSSRPSSSSDSKKPLKWSDKGRDKRVDYQQLTHVHQSKFKKGIAVDPLAVKSSPHFESSHALGDLLSDLVCDALLKLIKSGRVAGGFGSPPCSTVSAARHVPLSVQGGPRPLRSRDKPWDALPYCTKRGKSWQLLWGLSCFS
eukprot:s463_g5.t1